jgi:hypothetical protein
MGESKNEFIAHALSLPLGEPLHGQQRGEPPKDIKKDEIEMTTTTMEMARRHKPNCRRKQTSMILLQYEGLSARRKTCNVGKSDPSSFFLHLPVRACSFDIELIPHVLVAIAQQEDGKGFVGGEGLHDSRR